MDAGSIIYNLRKLIDYNWSDERRDFEINHHDDGDTHIFRTLVALDNWVEGTDHTPESYLRS